VASPSEPELLGGGLCVLVATAREVHEDGVVLALLGDLLPAVKREVLRLLIT